MTPPSYSAVEITRWQQPLVRELAWVLLAPPLLAPSRGKVRWLDRAWGHLAYERYRARLQALDQAPAELEQFLAARPDQRLGSHFEGLLAFWLADPANGLYRLLAHGLAVRQGGQTLGEIDFLVQDLRSGQAQHWEVAVKFYLGIAPGGDHAHWIGPGLRDRLDIKVARLLKHQLPLSRQSAARPLLSALGIGDSQPVCLLKGRLFYPPQADAGWAPLAADPQHLRGWWMNSADFLCHYGHRDLRWLSLPKQHWLTPVDHSAVPIGEAQSAPALIEQLSLNFDNRALAVIGLDRGLEVERGFITPPGWPNGAYLLNHKKQP